MWTKKSAHVTTSWLAVEMSDRPHLLKLTSGDFTSWVASKTHSAVLSLAEMDQSALLQLHLRPFCCVAIFGVNWLLNAAFEQHTGEVLWCNIWFLLLANFLKFFDSMVCQCPYSQDGNVNNKKGIIYLVSCLTKLNFKSYMGSSFVTAAQCWFQCRSLSQVANFSGSTWTSVKMHSNKAISHW